MCVFQPALGDRCGGCAPGYHGNPSQPSGRCQPCQCNNNIDITDVAACDRRTGECRKCLYNSEGPTCGICKSGYFGDASQRNCRSEKRALTCKQNIKPIIKYIFFGSFYPLQSAFVIFWVPTAANVWTVRTVCANVPQGNASVYKMS